MVPWNFLYENPLSQNIISWVIFFYGVALPILLILWIIGLKGFMEITKYEKGKGFLYKMNPITKLMLSVVLMGVAAVTVWWIGAILTLGIILLYLTMNDGVRKFLYISLLTFTSIIGGMWSVAPFTPEATLELVFPDPAKYTTIWVWPSYFLFMGYEPQLTLQALIYGIQISFRITAVLSAALLLVLTTTTSDIFRMFTKLKIPQAMTFSVLVGVRTVPRIFSLLDTSVKMQFMRGLGYGKSRILYPVYYLYAGIVAIVPTIVYLFRGAKTLAISADTRGFRAYPGRTEMKTLGFCKYDYVAFGVMFLLIILAVLANVYGFGRTIPYVGY
ncbi:MULTISPECIES: energy-coupling factor transporter transmembrane protein EcfT [Acidianus]|uniref:Cobalt ABC transporter n=1 Tax=Candidatus Acidianus copahuensis TaxID=1160895 RepID=A0A031LKF8_9CREN|nr:MULTISPECIES: energy-coupling factor transporter transmembrane protein EcfT [Acidianus]EZQ02041.1 cobalt ABC transporter [Candidatus Acidianus copahuensis]NON61537.1 energy-coupling factor transporter transmembrane protein EcfT [Acidianus sp. RZ1]